MQYPRSQTFILNALFQKQITQRCLMELVMELVLGLGTVLAWVLGTACSDNEDDNRNHH